ncbi:MAG: hypothetical protein K6U74_21090 [Firmicutes bacterium]|nr:hypothetical protein [Bacillota bacterium]
MAKQYTQVVQTANREVQEALSHPADHIALPETDSGKVPLWERVCT